MYTREKYAKGPLEDALYTLLRDPYGNPLEEPL